MKSKPISVLREKPRLLLRKTNRTPTPSLKPRKKLKKTRTKTLMTTVMKTTMMIATTTMKKKS